MSDYALADWHDAILRALRDKNVAAVPALLVAMAADGYGHEAEELRRQMLQAATTDEEH